MHVMVLKSDNKNQFSPCSSIISTLKCDMSRIAFILDGN